MKYVIWIIIVALIGFGAYWFMNNSDGDTDATGDTQSRESTDGDVNNGGANAEVNAAVDLDTPDKTFNMGGSNFEFTQTEIRVQEGDVVRIRLTSTEGFHDWVVDEFNASTDRVNEGETAEVTFVANQTGEFEYYCSVGNHRQQGMVGTIIVEPAE